MLYQAELRSLPFSPPKLKELTEIASPVFGFPGSANCAKSFVTRDGVKSVVGGYVVPEVGLPWLEWIKQ
jgi:hypothetical protein